MAAGWAAQMARDDRLGHGDWAGRFRRQFPGTAGSENVAAGQRSPAEVVGDWMTSAGHRANILGPYTAIGVGVATASGGTAYWCADFASPSRPAHARDVYDRLDPRV